MKEPEGNTVSPDLMNRSNRKRPSSVLSAVDMELENNEILRRGNEKKKCYDECLDGKAVYNSLGRNRTVSIRRLGVFS